MLAFAPSPHDIAWLLLLLVVVPIAWIIGLICFRRRWQHMLLWTALIALFYFGRLFVLPFAADHLGPYQLTVTIRDEQERPLPFLPVRHVAEPALSGLGRYANEKETSGATDASGRITVTAHHPPTTRLVVIRPGYPENSLYLGGPHRRSHIVLTSPSPPESVRATVLRPTPNIKGGYPHVSSSGDIEIVWTLSPP